MTVARPVPLRFYKLPTKGILSFGFDRGIRKSGPRKGSHHYHQGDDIVAPVGTELYALSAGYVEQVHNARSSPRRGFGGYGRIVVISYPLLGLRSLYAHCDTVIVAEGAAVRGGELVATIGRTAFRVEAPDHLCGAHVHLELAATPYPKPLDRKVADWGRIDPSAYLAANVG